jgi:hypothetical protein
VPSGERKGYLLFINTNTHRWFTAQNQLWAQNLVGYFCPFINVASCSSSKKQLESNRTAKASGHPAMSQPLPDTQHVVTRETVPTTDRCWGHYWHGLTQTWHVHDWPLHLTTKLRTPEANYTVQFACTRVLQYSIHPAWTRSNRDPR